jgi:predicted peptidase
MEKEIAVTVRMDYLLYLPAGYNDTSDRFPLVLFLHGAGERGDDLELVKKHGPPKLIAEGKDFPFICVSPQCPKESWWTTEARALLAMLDDLSEDYRIDEDRVYLTGLSMGGFGTWALAKEQPDRFAALAPICGGGDPEWAADIMHIPVWVFHGAKDGTVPLEKSREMVDALRAAGADPRFTVYPEAGHDSWTATYVDPAFYDWLLAQRRSGAGKE